MARLDYRADEDYRSVDQSHGTWRERIGRFPPGDSVDTRLRVFRQADHHRLGPRAHRASMGRAHEAPWIHKICGARRRLGCRHHRDVLDRELENRGHRFVRYADDCNIYVRSERAGQRVMESISRFITQKLKLKVNETKSADR